jgi:hypothetical protein
MRCALILTLLAGALLGQDVPMPEETAAMLLARNETVRERARTLLDRDLGRRYEREVLASVSRWAGDRAGWIADLEERAKTAGGSELTRIRSMLGHLQGAKGVRVETRVTFVSVPPARVNRMPTMVFASKRDWEAWWGALKAAKEVEVLFERTITTQDTRLASFAHGSKVSYVAGYDHDKEQGTISPVVKSVQTGILMQWAPHLSMDRRYVTLDCSVRIDHLKRPLAKEEVTIAGRRLAYEKPEIESTRMAQSVTLPAGGHAAWRLEDPAAKPNDPVVLVLVSSRVE